MSIEKLKAVLTPPSNPLYTANNSDQWLQIERKINRTLPQDYKDYIEHFGDGIVGEFVKVFNPFSPFIGFNFVWNTNSILPIERIIREDIAENERYALFPEAGGLLPIAVTENGDSIYWVTQGTSIEWKVTVRTEGSLVLNSYNMNLTTFLAELYQNTLFETDIYNNTQLLFDGSLNKEAPFRQSNRVEAKFTNLRTILSELKKEGKTVINKKDTAEIFLRSGFIIDHPIVQDKLIHWERKGFIAFPENNDAYIYILDAI